MSEEMMFNFNLLIFNDLSIDCPTPLPAPVTIALFFFKIKFFEFSASFTE